MVKHYKKKKTVITKRIKITQLANKEKGLESRINRLRACILQTAEQLGETRKEKNQLIDELHIERQVESLADAVDNLIVGGAQ